MCGGVGGFKRSKQTCAEEGVLRPRPSVLPVQLPEASNLSVPDLARTERKGARQLTGRAFFFSFFWLFVRLKECLCPLHFTEESNYPLRVNREQPGYLQTPSQDVKPTAKPEPGCCFFWFSSKGSLTTRGLAVRHSCHGPGRVSRPLFTRYLA